MSHCEKEKQAEHCCNCLDRKSTDISVALNHWQTNFEFQGWRLWYDTLAQPGEDNRLCKVGRCRVCGKCLCIGITLQPNQSIDSFLAAVYRGMYQLWYAECRQFADFREVFTSIFHDEDRPHVLQWLTLPENQSVWQMYRHDVGGVE